MAENNDQEVKMMREFLSSLVRDMRAILSRGGAPPFTNMNASGQSFESITFDIKTTPDVVIGILYGPSHIIQLERGRRAGKFPPRESILNWIQSKGIVPRGKMTINSLAFLIARKIASDGTRMNRLGHRSGILSETLTDKRLKEFFEEVMDLELLKVTTVLTEKLHEIGTVSEV